MSVTGVPAQIAFMSAVDAIALAFSGIPQQTASLPDTACREKVPVMA